MSEKLNEALDNLGRSFEAFKETNDKRLQEIEKHGKASGETLEKLAKIEKDMNALEDIKDRVEKMELAANRPGKGKDDMTPEQLEHSKAFNAWVRNPSDPQRAAALQQAERNMAVSTTTDSAGGYAVPEEISRQITSKIIDLSPIRRHAKVVQAGTKDYKELVNVRGSTGGWVGETDTRTETSTSALEEVAPTFGMSYAYPKATEESLTDIFFNVEQWVVNESAVALAKQEGAAFVSGNGTKKPTGFLNGTPVSTGDEASPARAFGVLQYFATGAAAGFANSRVDSPPDDPGDVFLDCVYGLKKDYRAGAIWLANKATLGTMRKFKDADGNYLWQPGLVAGQPPTFLGYGIEEDEEMPDIGANAFPVAFGNFREGYLIVDLVGLRITRDEITTPGYVKFYVRRRVGGKLKNDDAIKVIKCAAS